MILLCRRNIEFDPYVFLFVTPLIYAVAFYCLLNMAFKLEAFRCFRFIHSLLKTEVGG